MFLFYKFMRPVLGCIIVMLNLVAGFDVVMQLS
jgi:hypothetical protein